MNNRYWWSESQSSNYMDFHFKWTPCSVKQDFPKLNSGK